MGKILNDRSKSNTVAIRLNRDFNRIDDLI